MAGRRSLALNEHMHVTSASPSGYNVRRLPLTRQSETGVREMAKNTGARKTDDKTTVSGKAAPKSGHVSPRRIHGKTVVRGEALPPRSGQVWRVKDAATKERLSPADLAAVREGREAIRRGEFVTLEEYERKRGR